MRISPEESRTSKENSLPSPLALDHVRTLLLLVTRALIAHLLVYGVRQAIGWVVVDEFSSHTDVLALPENTFRPAITFGISHIYTEPFRQHHDGY